MDLVAVELDRVHERIAGRFARSEPGAPPSPTWNQVASSMVSLSTCIGDVSFSVTGVVRLGQRRDRELRLGDEEFAG